MASLLQPLKLANLNLQHRIVMSPMTRLRCEPGVEAFRALNATYYQQRTSPGGLIVSECVAITPAARGYVRAPGISSPAQLDGWRLVAKTIQEGGGYFFCQLFHPGRVSHSSLLPEGVTTVSASALGMSGKLYVDGGVKVPYEVPKALTVPEIKQVVADFAAAAKVAVEECGCDGVEIHAGNGYLLQQFMSTATNQRSDEYGGPIENRCRILLEVVDACVAAVGADRVGVKLQPGVVFTELIQPEAEVLETIEYLGPALSPKGLAYTCLSSVNGFPYCSFVGLSEPNVKTDLWRAFRKLYSGKLMINGGLSLEAGAAYVDDGTADLVSYGVPFIANANLPALVAAGFTTDKLNPGGQDVKVWYSKLPEHDAEGYTDWPLVQP